MGNSGYAARFRNIRNATRPWIQRRRRANEGKGNTPAVELKRGGRWRRPATRRQLLAGAAAYAMFLGMAMALAFGIYLGDTREARIFMAYVFLFVCVVIGVVVLWTGRFSRQTKILLTVPLLLAVLLAFV